MVNIARWKVWLIIGACALALLYAAPNAARLPGWLPSKTVNLGLDLQGGSHLLMQADIDSVIHDRADNIASSLRPVLRKGKIAYGKLANIPNGVRVTLNDGQDVDAAKTLIRKSDGDLDVSGDAHTIDAVLSPVALKKIADQTIDQSIEIVRRRIDETGTREPVIERQGADRIIVELPGVSDPEHIKEILGRTAKLTFNLVDTGKGVDGGARSLPSQEDPGRMIPISRRPMITGNMLTNAQPSQQNGMPDISFTLNGEGTRRFCDVTRDHAGEPFAIVLDDKVISAPRINEAICGGSAVITGQFTVQQTSDLAMLLRAGALPAPLKVMEERTVGPSLGADSVQAGKKASLIGFCMIVLFIVLTYGLFGVFASIALLINIVMIFAILSVLGATLTLPGIAGIVLTMGIAVDANVLIFERIREEAHQGRSPIAAIDAGYSRAMTSIIDSNLTSLIAGAVLYSIGTGPIKGFAVTMAIGIITSMFCAIMVTRLMVVMWLKKKKPSALPI